MMPNISIERLKDLEDKERQLNERITRESIGWVGERLGEALATVLALKPWRQWNLYEKDVLRKVCHNAETAYQTYLSRLPKD